MLLSPVKIRVCFPLAQILLSFRNVATHDELIWAHLLFTSIQYIILSEKVE